MDSEHFLSLLQDLDGTLDSLESALSPILNAPDLNSVTSKLPLLDKAKFHVLLSYAINSLLFSTLNLNSINPKAHAVSTELTRCKQYFDKIAMAENEASRPEKEQDKPKNRLDKAAAGRFISHALKKNDGKVKEHREREKASAWKKAEEISERYRNPQPKSEDENKKLKKRKRDLAEAGDDDPAQDSGKDGKEDSEAAMNTSSEDESSENQPAEEPVQKETNLHHSEKKGKKEDKQLTKVRKSTQPPKSNSELFKDLLKKGETSKS